MAAQMYFRARFGAALASLVLSLSLVGCAKPPPPPPKPTVLQISLSVDQNANPDARGRASPVVARVLELKSLAAFQSTDFFSLFDHEKDALGSELVAKEELLLQPGENRQFTRELQADTRFVAVLAAYRDIERSRWRASIPVNLNETTPVIISVRERDIVITQATRK